MADCWTRKRSYFPSGDVADRDDRSPSPNHPRTAASEQGERALNEDKCGLIIPQPIFVIPDELVNPSDIAQMQKHLAQSQSDQEYHTSISSFDRINQKRHTLHSVWSKMINSVSGISEELSVNILDSYPTPIALLAELEQASMDIEATSLHAGPQSHTTKKRKLKSDDPGLHIKRRLDRGWQPRPITGPASERVWQLFTNKSYDAPDF